MRKKGGAGIEEGRGRTNRGEAREERGRRHGEKGKKVYKHETIKRRGRNKRDRSE